MKMTTRTALAAVATVLARPVRALLAKPVLTLDAPVLDYEMAATPLVRGFVATPAPRAVLGTVRMDANDPKALIAQINAAVKELRETNDERFGKIEAKIDPLDVEKFEKISATVTTLEKALDEQARKIEASRLGGQTGKPAPVDAEYSNLFASYVRDGSREHEEKLKAAHAAGTPRAAMTEGSNTDGGYTTPIEWDRTITSRMKLISPIRQHAQVISISKAGFTRLFTDRQLGSGWVGETASRPATSTPQFTSLQFGLGEIYANAAASQQLLDDSEIDIEAWLTGEINTEFARQEGIAFLSGNGTNKPSGILTYVTGAANAAVHPWGDIKTVNSGAAGAFTTDGMLNAVYALPAMYEPNAKFFLNRSSLGAIRKLKDGQGNYIWQPTYVAGQPSTLLGRPVIDVPDMPNVGAGNIAALFGDMYETYLIIDRIGVRVLRDPYTNKPYICFYVTKRVGGGLQNPDSMKAIAIAA